MSDPQHMGNHMTYGMNAMNGLPSQYMQHPQHMGNNMTYGMNAMNGLPSQYLQHQQPIGNQMMNGMSSQYMPQQTDTMIGGAEQYNDNSYNEEDSIFM